MPRRHPWRDLIWTKLDARRNKFNACKPTSSAQQMPTGTVLTDVPHFTLPQSLQCDCNKTLDLTVYYNPMYKHPFSEIPYYKHTSQQVDRTLTGHRNHLLLSEYKYVSIALTLFLSTSALQRVYACSSVFLLVGSTATKHKPCVISVFSCIV